MTQDPAPLASSYAPDRPTLSLGARRLAATTALSVLASATALTAQSSALPDGPPVRIEILDGGLTANGTYIGALRLTLAEGWKTYWRSPGDAGIAPRFSWRGSRNIGEMTMTWPAPEVFLSSGFRTIGYHDQLVLPIEITPEKPGRPIRIKGRMELGVCKDVCVPSELRFDHQLDAKASRNPAIAAALASRPYSAAEAGVTAANCSLKPTQYGMQVEARITMPSAGGEELAVIEPGSPHLHAGETSTRRRGNLLVATTEFLPVQNGQMAAIDRSRLRITVLGQSHAVDITGCSAG